MSTLGEAFKGHPVQAQHPNFDLATAQEVPDSFQWPTVDLSSKGEVPVIDMESPDVVNRIGDACRQMGMFLLLNHGVPTKFLTDAESEGLRLFSLPVEQKLKAARSPEGNAGYGKVRIESFLDKQLWSEGFTITDSPLEHAKLLWPDDYSHFCEVVDNYRKEIKKLAVRLMQLLMESLGFDKDDISWAGSSGEFQDTTAGMHFNFYPACPNPEKALGMVAHTDSSLVTILHQNSTAGLQVLNESGQWVTVPALPNALVINLGDLLHILSNGQFKSAMHRAIVNHTQPRLSVVYFWGPPLDAEVSPIGKLVKAEEQPLYRGVTWPEFLKIKAVHFNDALSMIKQST